MKRFIITEDVLEYALADNYIKDSVWLTDYHWYHDNALEFEAWLRAHGCVMPGMIIKFPDLETLSLFMLKWS